MSEGNKVRLCALAAFILLASGAMAMTGCSTGPNRTEVVEVSKPVAVRPITIAQIPALPDRLPSRPPNVSSALDVAMAKICEWVAYGLRADPLLRVSAGGVQRAVQAYPECEGGR